MSTSLHVFKDDLHIATLPLQTGSHLLGISGDADLLIDDAHATSDLCFVEVSDTCEIVLMALPHVALEAPSGETVAELVLRNGHFAKAAGLTLTLVRANDEDSIQIDLPRTVPPTAKSPLLEAPPQEALVLRVTTTQKVELVDIDRPKLTIGREPGNTIRLLHPHVSAYHAAVVQKANGTWIEDAGSTNHTFMRGKIVTSEPITPGDRVYISQMPDAPVLDVLTKAAAMAWETASGSLLSLVGSSKPMQELRDRVLLYGPQREKPILILGETGTGKELVAKALAQLLGRDKPFIVFNCGDLERELAGSELFGHVRGAFTGAIRDRMGHVESAGHGTLFLDEIGELPLELQSKLLRVLEEGKILRRGESIERTIHCRFIAATHRDLPAEVKAGRFRQDLYQRLAGFLIRTPPLRDRLGDLPELVRALLGRARGDLAGKTLSPEALEKLAGYDWPGNVRELANTVLRAALHTQGLIIPAESIEFFSSEAIVGTEARRMGRPSADYTPRELAVCEAALREANGNVHLAARNLGKSYTSFRRRLARLGLSTFGTKGEG